MAPTAIHFQEIGVENKFEEAERVGVSLLTNPASEKIASEMEGLEQTVSKLSAMLEQSATYVQKAGTTLATAFAPARRFGRLTKQGCVFCGHPTKPSSAAAQSSGEQGSHLADPQTRTPNQGCDDRQ